MGRVVCGEGGLWGGGWGVWLMRRRWGEGERERAKGGVKSGLTVVTSVAVTVRVDVAVAVAGC